MAASTATIASATFPTGINSIDYYKFHQKTTGGFALRAVIDHCPKMAHIGKRLQISPFIYIMEAIAVTDFMLGEELRVPTGALSRRSRVIPTARGT